MNLNFDLDLFSTIYLHPKKLGFKILFPWCLRIKQITLILFIYLICFYLQSPTYILKLGWFVHLKFNLFRYLYQIQLLMVSDTLNIFYSIERNKLILLIFFLISLIGHHFIHDYHSSVIVFYHFFCKIKFF
jgi:hypothetical protein